MIYFMNIWETPTATLNMEGSLDVHSEYIGFAFIVKFMIV